MDAAFVQVRDAVEATGVIEVAQLAQARQQFHAPAVGQLERRIVRPAIDVDADAASRRGVRKDRLDLEYKAIGGVERLGGLAHEPAQADGVVEVGGGRLHDAGDEKGVLTLALGRSARAEHRAHDQEPR